MKQQFLCLATLVSEHLHAPDLVLGPYTGVSQLCPGKGCSRQPYTFLLETSWDRQAHEVYPGAAAWSPRSHLLQLLVLPVHEGLPMLEELALRPLEILKCPLPLNGAVLHSNDLSRDRSGCLESETGMASSTL